MLNLFSLISPVLNDAPEPWQIGFQDGASPAFEGITELHSSIFFYLVVILIGVVWMMGSIMVNFSSKNASIVYKYANHGKTWLLFVLLLLFPTLYLYSPNYASEYLTMYGRIYSGMYIVFENIRSGLMQGDLRAIFFFDAETACLNAVLLGKYAESLLASSPAVTKEDTQLDCPYSASPDMEKGRLALISMLTVLVQQPNKVVHDFLMSKPEVSALVDGKIYPKVSINMSNGDVSMDPSFPLVSTTPQSVDYTLKCLVYGIFNPVGGNLYVGSTISGMARLSQHRALASSIVRKSAVAPSKFTPNSLKDYLSSQGPSSLHWGVFTKSRHFSHEFLYSHPEVTLTVLEQDILNNFSKYFVRLKEQVIMNALPSTMNVTPVRFTYNWSPSDVFNAKALMTYEIIDSVTGQTLVTSNYKKSLARALSLTLNQFNDYLEHESSAKITYLDKSYNVFVRSVASSQPSLKTGAVQKSWLTTTPIQGIDPSLHTDHDVHLYDLNKEYTGMSFTGPTQAAWLLDGKSENKYILRYLNVERSVSTSSGQYYFIRNEALKGKISKTNLSIKPGAGRSNIILHDLELQVYVEMPSRNSVGQFLYNKPKLGGGTLDRYLYNNVTYKNRLNMMFKEQVPTGQNILSRSEYFSLLGREHFNI